jgi:hypothetical protein
MLAGLIQLGRNDWEQPRAGVLPAYHFTSNFICIQGWMQHSTNVFHSTDR